MPDTLNPRVFENLRRWQQSGGPRRWVEARLGRWTHEDWLALLEGLRWSPFWPLDPAAVRRTLEEARLRFQNLRRWERSGLARQWVEARGGEWSHDDWLALLDDLSRSSYWPLEPGAVGEVLEEIRQEWRNLRRWEQSGLPRKWVETHLGSWGPHDFLELQAALQQSDFWPLDPEAARAVLERCKVEYWNLQNWQQSDQPWRWVEAHNGRWTHDDWLALLETLRRSPYWPVAPEAVGEVLERVRAEHENLRRWEESGQPRRWVEERHGQWTVDDWLDLRAELRRSEFWPVEAAAAYTLLKRLTTEHGNLRRWRDAGRARAWVAARRGEWAHDDWQALLRDLQGSPYWPLDPGAVGRTLEEARTEYRNLRRWQQTGQPGVWVALRPGRWKSEDWRTLLNFLEKSEFWPMDPEAVRQLIEGLTPARIRAA